MLQHLTISNYALIEHLDINFDTGFSVITGETGAGKSIMLGALALLCGQRADAKTIKAGAQKCVVEAEYMVAGLGLEHFFEDNELDFDGVSCVVRREVTAAGKSRAFLNDTPVSLSTLKSLSTYLIDVHSQHQNLLMGREDFLIAILDVVAANTALREEYQTIYQEWMSCKRQLQDFRERMHSENIDVSYISFQLQQLDEAQLRSGEQEELEAELDVLSHAEDIKRMLSVSAQALTSDEYDVCQQLKVAVQNLNRIEAFYGESKELAERLESCRIEIADVCAELEQAAEDVAYNPERMACIEDRLSLIYTLQKKHHCATIDDLLALTARLQEQMDEAQNADQKLAELEARVAKSFARLEDVAKQLTTTRVQASALVGAQIVAHLQELGMPAAQIQFERSERSTPDASGMDSLKLLFSANKNVPVQDVAQIASGGEIARLMLSFKAMLANHQQLPTIVFDEIDTGVSGKMADAMARMMQKMSGNCQVICITHLPQIAALGQTHYYVYKSDEGDTTHSQIKCLDQEARIQELAKMLSGENITEAAIQNAKSLLKLEDKE